MAEQKEKYELMVILKPLLPDDVRKSAQDQIVKTIEKAKGKIVFTDIWGKRYLSYPIKGHKEGYYIVYQVEMPTDAPKAINASLKLHSEVLRHLLIQIDEFGPEDEMGIGKKAVKVGDEAEDK